MRAPLRLARRRLLLVAFLLIALIARPQQRRQAAADREQLFISSARALPQLYEKRNFDSIAYYVQLRWAPGPIDPDLFCEAILLSVQRHIFYLVDFQDLESLTPPVMNELRIYADVLDQIRRNCPADYHTHRGYDVGEIDRQLFLTTSQWAADLLVRPDLDSVERFLCRVYAGEIRYPEEYVETQMAPPAYNGVFNSRRGVPHKLGGVLTLSAGAWFPGGRLSLLGVHPSFNYGFGARSAHNEWDIDAALRFVNTPSPYTILRNDSVMSRNFYNGGNISLNYTRYLVHVPGWEFGVSTGLGVDFIDVASDQNQVGWSPTEITCFDWNVGMRYNWYFSRHGFLGFVARYHFLDYKNPGGSPFDGNAATFDIIIGRTGDYKH
jgi:hypothetical protein